MSELRGGGKRDVKLDGLGASDCASVREFEGSSYGNVPISIGGLREGKV